MLECNLEGHAPSWPWWGTAAHGGPRSVVAAFGAGDPTASGKKRMRRDRSPSVHLVAAAGRFRMSRLFELCSA